MKSRRESKNSQGKLYGQLNKSNKFIDRVFGELTFDNGKHAISRQPGRNNIKQFL